MQKNLSHAQIRQLLCQTLLRLSEELSQIAALQLEDPLAPNDIAALNSLLDKRSPQLFSLDAQRLAEAFGVKELADVSAPTVVKKLRLCEECLKGFMPSVNTLCRGLKPGLSWLYEINHHSEKQAQEKDSKPLLLIRFHRPLSPDVVTLKLETAEEIVKQFQSLVHAEWLQVLKLGPIENWEDVPADVTKRKLPAAQREIASQYLLMNLDVFEQYYEIWGDELAADFTAEQVVWLAKCKGISLSSKGEQLGVQDPMEVLTPAQKELVQQLLRISEREFLVYFPYAIERDELSGSFDSDGLVRFAARRGILSEKAPQYLVGRAYPLTQAQEDMVARYLQMGNGMNFLIRFSFWVERGELSPDFSAEELVRLAVRKRITLTPEGLSWARRSGLIASGLPEPPLQDFDAFVTSAKNETGTRRFKEWAGGDRVTLAIAFTDVVESTALGESIKDEAMKEVRRAHFAQSRKLISQFKGCEIKNMGDGFMAAFKSAEDALDYVLAFQENTGHAQVQIRAGIHIGAMYVEEEDVHGGTVNFAARVIGAVTGAEIWLSDDAKKHIDAAGAARYKSLEWDRHDDVRMKGFPSNATLWSLRRHTG